MTETPPEDHDRWWRRLLHRRPLSYQEQYRRWQARTYPAGPGIAGCCGCGSRLVLWAITNLDAAGTPTPGPEGYCTFCFSWGDYRHGIVYVRLVKDEHTPITWGEWEWLLADAITRDGWQPVIPTVGGVLPVTEPVVDAPTDRGDQ